MWELLEGHGAGVSPPKLDMTFFPGSLRNWFVGFQHVERGKLLMTESRYGG